ncbi:MAG: FAD-dependent oxidoreductase [Candidatus Competibacteraceae bacterium]
MAKTIPMLVAHTPCTNRVRKPCSRQGSAPEGRIYFAGEHVAHMRAWMQSAIETGIQAAHDITSAPMTDQSGKRWLGFAALFSTGLIMASFGVLIRWLDEELSAVQQIGLRYALAFSACDPVVLGVAPPSHHRVNKGLAGVCLRFPLGVIFLPTRW